MSGLDVSLQVPSPDQDLSTKVAPVGCVPFCVEPDVLVQVAGVSEGPEANFTLERFVTGVSPHMDFQAVFSGVEFAAVQTQVSLFGFARTGVVGRTCGHRIQPGPVLLRCDFR